MEDFGGRAIPNIIVEYQVASEHEVQAAIEHGWTPHGSALVRLDGEIVQPMVMTRPMTESELAEAMVAYSTTYTNALTTARAILNTFDV